MSTLKVSADKICIFMKENGLNLKQMARKMGMAPNTLRGYLRNDITNLTELKRVTLRLSMGTKDFAKIVVDENDDADRE